MTSTPSVYGNIKTTQVDVSYASKFESSRFLNKNYNICPKFNGVDGIGRPIAQDSYITKKEGCNHSLERIYVENDQRPDYIVNLNLQRGLYSMSGKFKPNGAQTDTQVKKNTQEVKKTINGAETFVHAKYRKLGGMTKYY